VIVLSEPGSALPRLWLLASAFSLRSLAFGFRPLSNGRPKADTSKNEDSIVERERSRA